MSSEALRQVGYDYVALRHLLLAVRQGLRDPHCRVYFGRLFTTSEAMNFVARLLLEKLANSKPKNEPGKRLHTGPENV